MSDDSDPAARKPLEQAWRLIAADLAAGTTHLANLNAVLGTGELPPGRVDDERASP